MKKKWLTYTMLVVVLAVWTKVGLDFFSYTNEETVTTAHVQPQAQVASTDSIVDKYELIGDYPDPFLGSSRKKNSKTSSEKKTQKPTKTTIQPVVLVNWPQIGYHGSMLNQNSGQEMAIVAIDGKQRILAEGESYKELIIQSIHKDSLIIAYAGATKTFLK